MTTNPVIMRSALERCAATAMQKAGFDATYETHIVPVLVEVKSKPDFFVPSAATIVEVKGRVDSSFELNKLTATSKRMPLTLGDTTYHSYIMCVQVNPSDYQMYVNCQGIIPTSARLRYNYPLTGLTLIHRLRERNITAIPITHSQCSSLIAVLRANQLKYQTELNDGT